MTPRPNAGTWAALTAWGIRNRSKHGNVSPILQSIATEAALTVTWTRTLLTENEVVTSVSTGISAHLFKPGKV